MAEIFETTPQNITMHLKRVYKDGAIDESATCKQHLQVRRAFLVFACFPTRENVPFQENG